MKNWKHYILIGLLAFLVLGIISCGDDDPPEEAEFRSETLTTSNGKIVTVNGTLLRSEMDSAKTKLTNSINAVLNGDDFLAKICLESSLFLGLTINLENNVTYNKYKVETTNQKNINFNAEHILKSNEIVATVAAAIKAMNGSGPTME